MNLPAIGVVFVGIVGPERWWYGSQESRYDVDSESSDRPLSGILKIEEDFIDWGIIEGKTATKIPVLLMFYDHGLTIVSKQWRGRAVQDGLTYDTDLVGQGHSDMVINQSRLFQRKNSRNTQDPSGRITLWPIWSQSIMTPCLLRPIPVIPFPFRVGIIHSNGIKVANLLPAVLIIWACWLKIEATGASDLIKVYQNFLRWAWRQRTVVPWLIIEPKVLNNSRPEKYCLRNFFLQRKLYFLDPFKIELLLLTLESINLFHFKIVF